MSSIGSITASAQAVYTGAANRKVSPTVQSAPVRDVDGDNDRSPPGDSIWEPGKGASVDVYA